jgi:hypothetical protein
MQTIHFRNPGRQRFEMHALHCEQFARHRADMLLVSRVDLVAPLARLLVQIFPTGERMGAGGAGSAAGSGGSGGFGGGGAAGSASGASAPKPSAGGGGAAAVPTASSNGAQVSPPTPSTVSSDGGNGQQVSAPVQQSSASSSEGGGGATTSSASGTGDSPPTVPLASAGPRPAGGLSQSTRITRGMLKTTGMVRAAQSAIPPDHAPHAAPPPLNTGSEGSE